MFNKVSVIGLGYIGLPTAAVFASKKKFVLGVDVNLDIVSIINRGGIHIVENELDSLVRGVVKKGYLRASTVPEVSDAFLVAVPTPFTKDYKPDVSYIQKACEAIAPVLTRGNLVILESTSPVGTTEKVAEWLSVLRPDLSFPQQNGNSSDIRVAYCPERVLPGRVLKELVENDRVIGGMTAKCSELAESLYKIFVQGRCLLTDVRTAEMCKLAENSFRDVNIAFANELSNICEGLNINPWELISLANRHPRVNILNPGPGVGGHCIAIDPWFIIDAAPKKARIIRKAREINDERPLQIVKKIEDNLSEWQVMTGNSRQPVVACLGLSYKANIDDVRSSPALKIVNAVADKYPSFVLAVEPNLAGAPTELSSNAQFVDMHDALERADVIVLLAAHSEFESIKLKNIDNCIVIDTCGALKGIAN